MPGNREEQMKEITERLEQGVEELFTSERYAQYLKTMSQFHNYSFNNTLLIAMQKPDATLVAGYQAWQKKFERHVLKGEKGIQIIAPTPIKKKQEVEQIDQQTLQPIIGADGQPQTEEVEVVIPRFRVTTVFDVSQTDGKPLPDISAEELTGNVKDYELFMQAIRTVAPVPIRFADINNGAKGYYSNLDKEIVIQNEMSQSQTMKTAVHETAHAVLHDRDVMEVQADTKNRLTKEVEAESVAFTVCQHFGLDTSDYSFAYIAGWSSDMEMKELRNSMDLIRTTAASFIDGIEEQLSQENVIEQPQTFSIYQLKDNEENRVLSFQSLQYLAEQGISISRDRYDLIYTAQMEEGMTLDSIFERFNINRPEDFTGHSLSVSDVVVINDGEKYIANYVDDFGFTEIPGFLELINDKEELIEAETTRIPISEMEETNMDYEQFLERLQNDLKEKMGDTLGDNAFGISDVNKVQGDSYRGLAVHPQGGNVGFSLNVQSEFENLENGMPYEEALDRIMNNVNFALEDMPQIDAQQWTNYENIKSKLTMELINTETNQEMLEGLPHRAVEDMSVVYRIVENESKVGSLSSLITNSMINHYGITEEQLHADAIENAPQYHPMQIRNMAEIISEMMGMDIEDDLPLYVANFTDMSSYGASVMMYPEFFDTASEVMNGDYFILPSSLHEIILVPDNGLYNLPELKSMVMEVNATEVSAQDKLTDNVYHYDSREKVFELAEAHILRNQEMALDDQAIWKIENNGYLHVQTNDEGYDYTFYNKDLREIDGGVLENPQLSIVEARNEILEDSTFSGQSLEHVDTDELMERIEAINSIPVQKRESISFYVAECMEYPIMGEYTNGLTLQEAVDKYNDISSESLHGIKGIGFRLDDGSMYDGDIGMLFEGKIDKSMVETIPHYKENPLVQEAFAELENIMEKNLEQNKKLAIEKETTLRIEGKDVSDVALDGKKESVLQALKERQEKVKNKEQGKSKNKSQAHKKGDMEL